MERLDVKTPTSPVTGSVSGACSLMIQPAALMATWLAVAAVFKTVLEEAADDRQCANVRPGERRL